MRKPSAFFAMVLVIVKFFLMTTHYHFLIETPHPNLSQAVKWDNVGYSVYFNRKRRRFGHLFQGRFKAVLVDADDVFKQRFEQQGDTATQKPETQTDGR